MLGFIFFCFIFKFQIDFFFLRCLESILFAAERCWAYSMHLKNEIGSPSSMSYERRHYHMKRKNKRAAKYAGQLRQLVNECNLVSFYLATKILCLLIKNQFFIIFLSNFKQEFLTRLKINVFKIF